MTTKVATQELIEDCMTVKKTYNDAVDAIGTSAQKQLAKQLPNLDNRGASRRFVF